MNDVLKLQNISKSYIQCGSIIKILDNINLNVAKGNIISITGSSGSGKSTLLHIAGLLDIPNSGKVIINGLNNKNHDFIRLHHMGFIYQQHHLLKDFTSIENVYMPLLIAGINETIAIKEAIKILTKLGLENKLYHVPGELSGGEQQRVAIARSLINKPSIILADEPTGNLDPKNSLQIFDLFCSVSKELEIAVIIVTHDHELANKADILYELRDGHLCLKS